MTKSNTFLLAALLGVSSTFLFFLYKYSKNRKILEPNKNIIDINDKNHSNTYNYDKVPYLKSLKNKSFNNKNNSNSIDLNSSSSPSTNMVTGISSLNSLVSEARNNKF